MTNDEQENGRKAEGERFSREERMGHHNLPVPFRTHERARQACQQLAADARRIRGLITIVDAITMVPDASDDTTIGELRQQLRAFD